MDFQTLISNITPDIYQNLKSSLELGKWPTGQPLSPEQKELITEALIAYEHEHLPENQRTGFIERGKCKSNPSDDVQTVNLIDIQNGDA